MRTAQGFKARLSLGAGLVLAAVGGALMLSHYTRSEVEAPAMETHAGARPASPLAAPDERVALALAAPQERLPERAPDAFAPTVAAWSIQSAASGNGDRQAFKLQVSPALYQDLSAGQELRFPTPGSELRFKIRLQAASDAEQLGRFRAGQGRSVKVTGLNQGDGRRQTLDMVLDAQHTIGSLEDGDKLYVFVLTGDGRGEMVEMPDKPAPRPLSD